MYIIYKGEVSVIFNERVLKVFQQNEHLGRNALETDAPRSATLIANKECHLLILSGVDY
jgi:CRP-like cAMP-binding protein